MNSLDSLFPGQSYKNKGFDHPGKALGHAQHSNHQGKSGNQALQAESVRVSLSASFSASSSHTAINMDVFYDKLSEKLGLPPQSEQSDNLQTKLPSGYTRIEPISPQTAAGNILGFVEKRMASEAANGASQDKLADLLEQARAGVAQGYGEAREQLEGMGLMSDTLNDEINESFGLVNEGLDKLEEKYLGQGAVAEESVADDLPTEAPTNTVDAANYRAGYAKQVGYDEQLNLQVRTLDGDIVSISLRETGYSSESFAYGRNGGGEAAAYEKNVYFAGDYQFQVDGELDEGELEALNDLFGQVDEVAGLFFEGDFQEAFSYATEMGFDSSELASFSLNMTQTHMAAVSAYEKASGADHVNHRFEPFGRLVAPAMKAFDASQHFDSGLDLLNSALDKMLADRVAKQEDNDRMPTMVERYREMVDALMDRFAADETTTEE